MTDENNQEAEETVRFSDDGPEYKKYLICLMTQF